MGLSFRQKQLERAGRAQLVVTIFALVALVALIAVVLLYAL
jgi:hypothetical protein